MTDAHEIIGRLREIIQGGMDGKPGYETDREIYGQMHGQVLRLLEWDVFTQKNRTNLAVLEENAHQALSDLEDWHHVNVAEFTGWGEGEVPQKAEDWLRHIKGVRALLAQGPSSK